MAMKGYLKTIEAVIAIVMVSAVLIQFQPRCSVPSEWDSVTLQSKAESAIMVLYYTGELRDYVYRADYNTLNFTLNQLIPAYVAYNVRINDTVVINNGGSDRKESVPFFLSGTNNTYSPTKLELEVWFKD